MKTATRLLSAWLALSFVCNSMALEFSIPGISRQHGDEAARLILEELRAAQPYPYGLPDENTYNYWWAQHVFAFLAAERCGYMTETEALARIRAILDHAQRFERHHGFWYDRYDIATGKKTTDQIYFQGWWLFALIVLKEAYPELHDQCVEMLDDLDYETSGMYDPETGRLAADLFPETGRVNWSSLYGDPTGEFRTPYVAYTYLNGDIRPWTRRESPRTIDIEGAEPLSVWHNFIFCPMLVHSVFPDVGYLERSWRELLLGLNAYREKHDMTFFPTRAEPLEAWLDVERGRWPNTEHGIAKPWLAWFDDPDAPVMEKAFVPGHGVSLYYDNMDFYWCYGWQLEPCPYTIGTDLAEKTTDAQIYLPFRAFPLSLDVPEADPVRLTALRFYASCEKGVLEPSEPLQVFLNGTLLCEVEPSQLGPEPRRININLEHLALRKENNVLSFRTAEKRPGNVYQLYRYPYPIWKADRMYTDASGTRVQEEVPPPYAEITLEGPHRGGENAFAFLARCAVIHDYFPWYELKDDEQFFENTVVWVGEYYNRAGLGRIVHNTSDTSTTVHYDRPAEWKNKEAITVRDITAGESGFTAYKVGRNEITWRARPWHTYRVMYEE